MFKKAYTRRYDRATKLLSKYAAPKWRKVLKTVMKENNPDRVSRFTYDMARGLPKRDIIGGGNLYSEALRSMPSKGMLPSLSRTGELDNVIRRAYKEERRLVPNPSKMDTVSSQYKTRISKGETPADILKDRKSQIGRTDAPMSRGARREDTQWVNDVKSRLDKNVDPEELININYGGGKNFLNDVMSKKNPGYPLEHSERLGIQVHPLKFSKYDDIKERESFYASRGSSDAGDMPASLNGSIKAKYLQGQRNLYEAGIPTEHLNKIQNMKITPLDVRGHGRYSPDLSRYLNGSGDFFNKSRVPYTRSGHQSSASMMYKKIPKYRENIPLSIPGFGSTPKSTNTGSAGAGAGGSNLRRNLMLGGGALGVGGLGYAYSGRDNNNRKQK